MDLKQYGAYLRSLRIGQGKGKEEVARAMKIPLELLESWEDGLRQPSEEQLQLLSAALQVTYDQVYPPDAPKIRKGLSHGQIALIIAGGIFALAMTLWSFQTYNDLFSSAFDRSTIMEEQIYTSVLKTTEGQLALAYVTDSPVFAQLGLKKEDISLINYQTGYQYSAQGLMFSGEFLFQAGDYQFQVTCIQQDGQWAVESGSAILPL